jgi:hypothetical protein
MSAQTYAWRGIDDPLRVDRARLVFDNDGLHALGTTIAPSFGSVWQLEVDRGWVTRELCVTTRGFGWSRTLQLTRSEQGAWAANVTALGDNGLPAAGLADPQSVDEALDCDLGLCPVTNTMPINRLGLVDSAVPPASLVMAWVDVPSLRVTRSDQVYGSSMPGQISYASPGGNFHADLTCDRNGVVIDYPGLATRIPSDP